MPIPSPVDVRKIRWQEMRCVRCHRLLQKVEESALRPGKHLEIKCVHCKIVNYLVGQALESPAA